VCFCIRIYVICDKLRHLKPELQVSCGNRLNDATCSPAIFTAISATTIINVLVCNIFRCISNLRVSPSICCPRMVQNRRGASLGCAGRQRIFPQRWQLLDIRSALPAPISQHQIYYNRSDAVISRHIFPARTLVRIQAPRHPPARLCRRFRQVLGLVLFGFEWTDLTIPAAIFCPCSAEYGGKAGISIDVYALALCRFSRAHICNRFILSMRFAARRCVRKTTGKVTPNPLI
jgi:hypothetical protein